MPKKTIEIFGRSLTISGSEGDSYYGALPDGADLTDSVMLALRPLVTADATYFDIGANIGLYSLGLAVLAPGSRVYSFEPSPGTFEYLSENLKVNNAHGVKALQLALGERPGTVPFHDVPFFTAGSFTVNKGSFLTSDVIGSSLFEAPCVTLDEFVKTNRIDEIRLIKIDVEGGEMSVLRGASDTIKQQKPIVALEFSSFAFTIHQDLLPQQALVELKKMFPYLYVMDRGDGSLSRLNTDGEIYDFLYDNGLHGPVDNLLCTFEDLGVDRGYRRVFGQAAPAPTEVSSLTSTPDPVAMPQSFGKKVASVGRRGAAKGLRTLAELRRRN